MKKLIIAIVALAAAIVPASASEFKLSDLFNGSTGQTVGNLLEGVFSTSDITVADMAGVWTVDGSAVCFQSENLLSKAGGLAATAAIKKKLDPYFKKYGLIGSVITIQQDGTFTIKIKKMKFNGIVQKQENGTFLITFTALGSINIGEMTAYVQKTPQTMDIMFDATQLKNFVDIVAKLTGSKLASSALSILDSYDGIRVGFGTKKTGNVETTGTQQSGLGGLLNVLGGGAQSTQTSTQTQTPDDTTSGDDTQSQQQGNALLNLLNIMGVGSQNKK